MKFSLKARIIEATPLICLIAYLFIGFVFKVWHPTWAIFFLIPIVPIILSENFAKTVYPIVCVIIYLVLGFTWGFWHPGWLIFLTIPVYYILFRPVIMRSETNKKKKYFEFVEEEKD